MSTYIDIPHHTTINEIISKNYSLSATQYKTFCINNKNCVPLSELLDRELKRDDLGSEVGSTNYVDDSDYYFIKTKALQPETMLLDITKESYQAIAPTNFVQMDLKAGDILISKDSNVGEIAILDKDYPNAMLCGAIYRLPITKYKYYLLAMIKSELFRQQIDFLVPRGSTIRHGKTKFLECQIPFPNSNVMDSICYVEYLMKAIINKEIAIHNKHELILSKIHSELMNNQTDEPFKYTQPTLNDLLKYDRMDSCIYSEKFKQKEFLIKNYKYGTSSITDLGFSFVRGNNLAVSVIGKSIYSDTYHKGFYTLILPKNISKYGTMNKIEYLGNKSKMVKVSKGAIIFGAEGNEKGRSWIVLDDISETITNFHGLTLYQTHSNIQKSVFIKLFLDYLRSNGMIDDYATGGNGGSLSIKYWSIIPFPNMPDVIEKEIVRLYYNPEQIYNPKDCTLETFLSYDDKFNNAAGIHEIDLSLKYLQTILNDALQKIANDIPLKIIF